MTIKDKAWKHEHIQKMLSTTNKLRNKSILLLASSSGIRRGGIPGLRIKDLEYIEEYGIYQITVYPLEEEEYITFCSPECAKMLNGYFEFRKECGEVITDESLVIRDDFDREDENKARNAQPTTEIAIKNLLEGIVKNAGLEQQHINGSVRTEIFIAHGHRKFFETNLDRANLQKTQIEKLMGWGSKRGLFRNYNRRDIEELQESYVQAIPYLTINEETRLKSENELLKEKDKRIAHLEKQVAAIVQAMKKMRSGDIDEQSEGGDELEDIAQQLLK